MPLSAVIRHLDTGDGQLRRCNGKLCRDCGRAVGAEGRACAEVAVGAVRQRRSVKAGGHHEGRHRHRRGRAPVAAKMVMVLGASESWRI